ncbi:MAG TPA: organomercurial lyase [Candidatus Didemnitutus sp.]|nr:organomercurial lyase [Candidatus Didemnitutus sp.]
MPDLDALVHHQLVRGLIDQGRVPTNGELADALKATPEAIEASLRRLHDGHGLVLHPHRPEPWVIHPFATSPTLTWVAQHSRGWWSPCIWCGLGVATLVGGEVTIQSRLGGESSDITIRCRDGNVHDSDLWAHFPEPPRFAWGNVHHFCARLLPFARREDVLPWAERHGFVPGQVLPLAQLADLARRWYGRHADRDWHKWTVAEAADIFREAGLTGPFWSLDARAGTY